MTLTQQRLTRNGRVSLFLFAADRQKCSPAARNWTRKRIKSSAQGIHVTESNLSHEPANDMYFAGVQFRGLTENDPYTITYTDPSYVERVIVQTLNPRKNDMHSDTCSNDFRHFSLRWSSELFLVRLNSTPSRLLKGHMSRSCGTEIQRYLQVIDSQQNVYILLKVVKSAVGGQCASLSIISIYMISVFGSIVNIQLPSSERVRKRSKIKCTSGHKPPKGYSIPRELPV